MDFNIYDCDMNKDFMFNLPELPQEFLNIVFEGTIEDDSLENTVQVPSTADSEIFCDCNVLTYERLTYGDDVKEIFSVELPSYGREYEPGDTIGILPCNRDSDLTVLFNHMNMNHLVNQTCVVEQKNNSVKLKSEIVYLNKCTTLYHIFKYFVDVRCLPKKSLIRVLAEYTKNKEERLFLEYLCSKEGSKKYDEVILGKNFSFLDLVKILKTCCPPVERLLENLPGLLPRSYSIASSPLSSSDRIKIVFTVANSLCNGEMREGLCTGMLKSIAVNKLQIPIRMFYRKPTMFRLPSNGKVPLIFIGPGSGVAPFIGFLEHRKMQKLMSTIWLFYGCRYKSKDYIFKSELDSYLQDGVLTKLIVSFSREDDENEKYVQDKLKKFGKNICDMICEDNAIIYVCGDAKGLRKDVMNAFIEIIQQHNGLSFKEASNFVRKLQKENRYLQDVWL